MKNFTHNFAIHSLSKKVLELIEQLEHPKPNKPKLVERQYIDTLYNIGQLNKQEHIFMTARIILNDFCEEVEQHIGRGAKTGFLFYCQDRKLLCYGAGSNYPQPLKEFCIKQPPSLDMETKVHYKDDMFHLQDIEDWPKDSDQYSFVPIFQDSGVKSMMSTRMREDGLTFGTFEVYFPDYGGLTDEEIQWIREKLEPVKEQLFLCRDEMLEAVYHAVDRLGDGYTHNPAKSKTQWISTSLRKLSIGLAGLKMYECAFPMVNTLIQIG